MIKRKKLLIGLILLLCISLMTGCPKLSFISSDKEGYEMSKELLEYLDSNDAEGIESMLCDITKAAPDTEEEIIAAMEFFDGKVTSRDRELIGSQESVRKGETVYLSLSSYIKNVETDKNKTYKIRFYAQVVNKENASKVGISKITITDEDGNECVIGEFLERY